MSTKRKLSAKLGQPQVKQSAKPVTKEQLNDARAIIVGGANTESSDINGSKDDVVEISSDSGSDYDDEEDSEIDEDTQQTTPGNPSQIPKPDQDGDEDMLEADLEPEDPTANNEEQEQAEPSFGDLVHATTSTIDVASFSNPDPHSTHPTTLNPSAPTTSASLGTVLSQALRTNDTSLLESCLSTLDPAIIRATIQRLSSPLASTLLSKLAERLHRRPGRAGSLMVWVQWTLVTHGGYLATQPDLIKRLAELNRVIDERSKSLQSLLSLKGKLDMLAAQIDLRRQMQDQRHRVVDDDDDEGIIYVEGQESDDEDGRASGELSDLDEEMSEDMPMGNGIITEIEDSEEDSDEEDLIDDEAEESDLDEDDVDHDDQDSEHSGEESEDGVRRPSKMQRI